MNESFNVFDASDALIESESRPEPEAPSGFEQAPVEDSVEPDYFVVEAPRRRSSLAAAAIGILAAGFSRRRALAALALLGGLVLVVSLLGSASGSGGAAPAPAPEPPSVARVEAPSPAPASERRAWVENEKRAMRSQHEDEPSVAPAELAGPGREPARPHPRHSPAPTGEPAVEAEPEPAPPPPEPETTYYPPPEAAPAPTTPPPAPSPSGGSQEFGIEP
ncbi:MAG TPA: hypothetical protein VG518_11260 [Solirubrobacterales bacterium]|nr:hypothetical protein [Solirubrobacterales bacterium]